VITIESSDKQKIRCLPFRVDICFLLSNLKLIQKEQNIMSLTKINYEGQPVLTTTQMAEQYGTTEKVISNSFARNKRRYQEGTHFYVLGGEKLKSFKAANPQFGGSGIRTHKLYLWTKAGALLIASSLNADNALDTYSKLADTYFNAKEDAKTLVTSENGGIQNFFNPEFGEIRTILIDNEPWFVGKDVATILAYSDTDQALRKHVDPEDKSSTRRIDGGSYSRDMIIINESGLYSLILSSKLPTAKKFKRWVTAEVLPAIRKTGGYIPSEGLSDLEIVSRALLISQRTIEEKNKTIAAQTKTISEQAEKIQRDAPKVQFADSVSESSDCIMMRDLAKLLKQNGIDTGEKRLFAWLRESGYLIKQHGSSWNTPTQRAMELGLFKIAEKTVTSAYGGTQIDKTTRVTGKGQQYFLNKYLNRAASKAG